MVSPESSINSELNKRKNLQSLRIKSKINILRENDANLIVSDLNLLIFQTKNSMIAKIWLIFGICALGVAGLFSILLVIFRMPGIQSLFHHNFFYPALIVHVNLSVLIWLLSISAMLSLSISSYRFRYIALNALIVAGLGIVFISISPFFKGEGVMNNYVPILNNFIFAIGLALFLCGIFLQLITVIISYNKFLKGNIINNILYSIVLILVLAIISAVISYYDLKGHVYDANIEGFYEMLFWSAGHILQFAYTQLMQLAWLIMLVRFVKNIPNYFIFPFIVNVTSVLPSIFIHFKYSIDDWQFKEFFTNHMIFFGGIAPTIMIIMVLRLLYKQKSLVINDYRFFILISSIILFLAGGAIGFLIHGSNVIIPAHYHGAIVSVTLACMGIVYVIVSESECKYTIIKLHPILQAGGQLLHIIGLAWSGGYGVLRKNPGEVAVKAKIAMSLMGVGGLFSIIGGSIFVFIIILLIFFSKYTKINIYE